MANVANIGRPLRQKLFSDGRARILLVRWIDGGSGGPARGVGVEPPSGITKIARADDVVALEHGSGFVTRELHRHALGYAYPVQPFANIAALPVTNALVPNPCTGD